MNHESMQEILSTEAWQSMRRRFASIVEFNAHVRVAHQISTGLAYKAPGYKILPLTEQLWRITDGPS